MTFSRDGKRIASASGGGDVTVWDAETGEVVATLHCHEESVNSFVFTPDSDGLISGSRDKTIRIWDVERGTLVRSFTQDHGVRCVDVSRDGKYIVLGSFKDATVRVLNFESGTTVALLRGHEADTQIDSVAFSSDGRRVFSAGRDATIRLWEVESEKKLAVLHADFVWSVALGPEGKRVVSGSSNFYRPSQGGIARSANTIQVWDIETGEAIWAMAGGGTLSSCVAFSPDGKRIVSGANDNTVRVWNADTGETVAILQGHEGGVDSVAFSSDGKRIVSGSSDGTVRVWESELSSARKMWQGAVRRNRREASPR